MPSNQTILIKKKGSKGKKILLTLLMGVAMVGSFLIYQNFSYQGESASMDDVTELDHSSQYGGNGGDSFAQQPNGLMTRIHIRYGDRIDQIGSTVNGQTAKHGGNGGHYETIDTKGICINQITIRYGNEVDALTFHGFYTDSNRTYQSRQYGGNGGKQEVVRLGGCLNGFIGRSGDRLDKLGFISVKEITQMRGQWKLVESYTGDINYWVEETTIKESSNAMDKMTASQYSISTSTSFSYFGASGSIDTSYATQNYLKEQFRSYQYNSKTTKQQRVCKSPDHGHSAQIWQFMMEGKANDGKTLSIASAHFVCSSSKFKAPKCIPERCANGVCDTCRK